MGRSALARRIAVTTGAEAFAVGVGAIAGFLIVHHLPKELYAQYTFLATCVALLTGLSDLGISHSYLPVVGERAADTGWVRRACHHVYRSRWRLLLPALAVVVPYWLITASRQEWRALDYQFASVVAILGVGLTLREQLSRTVLAILQRVAELNRVGLFASVAKLLLVVAVLALVPERMLLSGLMLATAIGILLGVIVYGRLPELADIDRTALLDAEAGEVDRKMRAIVKPLVVPLLFYQFQGSITVALVGLFGAAGSIAEVGALTRPALILAVVDRVTAMLFFPRIARAPSGPSLARVLLGSQLVFVAGMSLLLYTAIFWPEYWMLLIGPQYAAQTPLLWMAFLAAILMNCAGFVFTTLSARGWTAGQTWLIPLVLLVQVIFVSVWGVGSTALALAFSVASAATLCLFQYAALAIHHRIKA